MRGYVSTDAELAVLAGRQYGIVAVDQLGMSADAIERRCSAIAARRRSGESETVRAYDPT
jgi:hypothetical protein